MNPFKGKKNKLGFQTKVRPRPEIDREYQALALQTGHKSRLIVEHTTLTEQLQQEVQEHIEAMRKLDQEFQKAPADAEKTPEPNPKQDSE